MTTYFILMSEHWRGILLNKIKWSRLQLLPYQHRAIVESLGDDELKSLMLLREYIHKSPSPSRRTKILESWLGGFSHSGAVLMRDEDDSAKDASLVLAEAIPSIDCGENLVDADHSPSTPDSDIQNGAHVSKYGLYSGGNVSSFVSINIIFGHFLLFSFGHARVDTSFLKGCIRLLRVWNLNKIYVRCLCNSEFMSSSRKSTTTRSQFS